MYIKVANDILINKWTVNEINYLYKFTTKNVRGVCSVNM